MNCQDRGNTAGAADAVAERRKTYDRRRHGWRTLTYCGFRGRGRRCFARRNSYDYYLDWYDPRLVFTGITVLVMSGLDALFTLALRDRGAQEANFFMAQLMESSDELFVVVKLAVTALGIMFLLMHAHFQLWRIISGKALLQSLVIVYGLLIGYELVLLGLTMG